jgi:hypothetical protein
MRFIKQFKHMSFMSVIPWFKSLKFWATITPSNISIFLWFCWWSSQCWQNNHNLSALLHNNDSWIHQLSITSKNLIIFCKTQQLPFSVNMLFVDRRMCSFSYWSSAMWHVYLTLSEQQTPYLATQEKMDPHNLRSFQLITTCLRPMNINPQHKAWCIEDFLH